MTTKFKWITTPLLSFANYYNEAGNLDFQLKSNYYFLGLLHFAKPISLFEPLSQLELRELLLDDDLDVVVVQ